MTGEEWELLCDVAQQIVLRFKQAELEIEKLKFRIEQLERQNDKDRSPPNP